MNINTEEYDETCTVTVQYNISRTAIHFNKKEGERASKKYMQSITRLLKVKVELEEDQRSIDLLKDALGKQQMCKNYSRRFWVWTVENDGTVLNILAGVSGIAWEMKADGDVVKALDIIKWVVEKIEESHQNALTESVYELC